MKLKTDENIGSSGVAVLREAGHDVTTVREQSLAGSPDAALFQACAVEDRILVTLDRDFGQTHRFPPARSAGIVILELGGPASQRLLRSRLRDFLAVCERESFEGRLWIVEPGRVRIHLEKDD